MPEQRHACRMDAATIGVRDVVASLRDPKAYAFNVHRRIAQRNIDQIRAVSGILCPTHYSHRPWPESVISNAKLVPSASNALHSDIASRAAGIAARTGWAASRRRAIAPASIKPALPSNRIEDFSVDLPDPFGPAITVNVGTLLSGRRDFAGYPEMRCPALLAGPLYQRLISGLQNISGSGRFCVRKKFRTQAGTTGQKLTCHIR
jgi:hypothetical protein